MATAAAVVWLAGGGSQSQDVRRVSIALEASSTQPVPALQGRSGQAAAAGRLAGTHRGR